MNDQSEYTLEFRIMAACFYHDCDKSIAEIRSLKKKLRDRFDDEPPRTSIIAVWETKLFTTGSILDMKRSGRPNERGDVVDEVAQSVVENPTQSIRKRSGELEIPYTTLRRSLKMDLGLRAWKPTMVQYLSEEDHAHRVQCCRQILQKYDTNLRRHRLFYSDECAIYAEGKSNVRVAFWSKENPHFWEQVRQHPPKVMVWAAMSEQHLIGPFFFDGGVTAEAYIAMLRDQFVPALEERGILLSTHFQQDGAPAHTAIATRHFLTETFQDRWVSKFGPTPWPPRSPDLTSCDNALWGLLKPKIVALKTRDVEELKDAVRNEFEQFPRALLQAINVRTFRRMHLCIQHNGLQVEPFDI